MLCLVRGMKNIRERRVKCPSDRNEEGYMLFGKIKKIKKKEENV